MSSNLKNIINLVVGDWSDDGHGKSRTITIKSNLTIKQIEQAYSDGVDEIGIDVTKDIAAEYEDYYLSDKDRDTLVKAGFDYQFISDSDGEQTFLTADDFVEMWAFIVKCGNKTFDFEYINNEIIIGGYGLYE